MKSILVVDDEPIFREIYSEFLQDAGLDCQTASTLDNAIAKLSSNTFDFAILDIRLVDNDPHNEDGLKILDWLVQNQVEIRVIVCTGFPTGERMRRIFMSGIVLGFFGKSNLSIDKILSILSNSN